MKVAQLAGFVAEKTNYHHGEVCLFDTITKMAQDFPGSNNCPYFEKDGQYVAKITNLSDEKMNLEVEFGDTNGREMIIPGIVILTGGLMIVISLYFKLRDYRIEQPDEKIS